MEASGSRFRTSGSRSPPIGPSLVSVLDEGEDSFVELPASSDILVAIGTAERELTDSANNALGGKSHGT